MGSKTALVILIIAAAVGFGFAAFSTHDFVAHLDRQVHGIHCSFLPGITASDPDSTGCQVTLMSPYSSVMRESIWGGLPIALPAMSVFAFLVFWAIWLWGADREDDRHATTFTLFATALPLLSSLVMGYISLQELDAACKLCIGIYGASALAFLAAVGLHLSARPSQPGDELPLSTLGMAFGIGLGFVALPTAGYAMQAPDFSHYVGTCGQLEAAADPRVPIPLGPQDHPLSMLEVIDPLCPSCAAFEERLAELPAHLEVSRKAVLFPLDRSCNWMVDDSIHPGACAVSEAIVCADERAEEVLAWSFTEREAIIAAATEDPEAAARMVTARFPELADCIGSSEARAEVNLALRWAIDNRIRVLTPQIYVEGLRLCDEDTDLGLAYALPRLIARARSLGDEAPARNLAPPEPAAIARALASRAESARAPAEAKPGSEPPSPAEAPPAPDAPGEGEAVEGEATEGEDAEGEAAEDEDAEDEDARGEAAEGDSAEGDSAEGDAPEPEKEAETPPAGAERPAAPAAPAAPPPPAPPAPGEVTP